MRSGARAAAAVVRLAFAADPWRASWVLVRSPLSFAAPLGTAYGLKLLVDAAVVPDARGILLAAGLITTVMLVGLLTGVGSFRINTVLREKASLTTDRRLIELALGIPGIEHHERPDYADELELLRRQKSELGGFLDAIGHNAGMLVQIGGTVLLLSQVHPVLALLPLAGLPSLWLTARAETMRQRARERGAEKLRLTRHLFELATTAGPAKEVRVFGLGPTLVRRHEQAWDDAERMQDAAAWRGAALASLGWVLFAAAFVGAMAFIVVRAAAGRASPGEILMALTLAAQVNTQVQGTVMLAGWLLGTLATARRFVWLADYAAARRFRHPDPAHPPERIESGIRVESLSFRYPGTDDDVLRDITLELPAGATVALVGENGAGKSTLVKLLARFYDPSAGRILLDGRDLRSIDPVAWRTRTSAGFQDFARLELLARETVGVGDLSRAGDEPAVQGALARAAAADVVDALPSGLGTPLGRSFDEGVELSGGQWQKLALGRAMMREAPLLLVLDEPTASLDAETEHALFVRYAAAAKRVAQRTGGVTVLVSHRFSTVRTADVIVVLDDGAVVEHGSHEELLARAGTYAELYELQARGYR